MVRTKADNSARKAVAAKAPRKQVGGGSSSGASSTNSPRSGSSGSKGFSVRGNPMRKCPTPAWQKGVGDFFSKAVNAEDTHTEDSDSEQDSAPSSQEPSQSTSTVALSSSSSSPTCIE